MVSGAITHNSASLARRLALQGVGLVYAPMASLAAELDSGLLQLVLEDWVSPRPALHVYYPGRRKLPLGLRLLVDLIREKQPLGF